MNNLERDEQLRLYEQIVSNMANGVRLIRTSDGIIVYTNTKFEKLFGYSHNELLGMHVSKLNAPTDIPPEQRAKEIKDTLNKNGVWHGEIKNIKKDGTVFYCHADVSTFNHSTYGKVFIAIHTDITNQVVTREKLKQAQLYLKSSIESSKGLIILSIDTQYRYLYFNDAHKTTMKSVYGVEVEIGMNMLDCISEKADRVVAKECYDIALAGNSYSKIDEYGKNANLLYYETEYNPIYNDANAIIGVTAFAREITIRKRFEIELKESEERFKKLSELSFEGIVIHKNGIAIDINKAFENITGYKKEELIGQNLIKLLVPIEFQETVEKHMRSESFEPYEIIFMRKDGVNINILFSGRREIIYKGEKVIVSAARDVSESRKNELKIKKSEADLVSQIENTSDSIWSVDKNYRITVTNSTFFRNFKIAFNHELKLNDKVLDYLPESLKPIWKNRYDKALLGEHFSTVDQFEFEKVHQYVESSFNPVIVDNQIEGVACFTKDITKQKIAEKELKDSNTTKNKFLSIIAHDLRNPFSNILWLSNYLKTEYGNLSNEERMEYIDAVSVSSNQTFLLLENLLNWAKAQQGGIKIEKTTLDLKKFINEAIEPYMQNAKQKDLIIKYNIINETKIVADEYTIMTVLRNLFSNAVKFTPNGGVIQLKAQENSHGTSIEISDSGIGIDKNVLSNLFLIDESFSTPGTNNEQGSGLGLVLCKEFVELNGGDLQVESKKGMGSTFSFTLPK